jgi:hypothetical protein
MGSELRPAGDEYGFGTSVRDFDCDCCGRLVQAGETFLVGANPDGSRVRLAVCCALSRGLVVDESS